MRVDDISLEDIAIMYHYVNDSKWKGIVPLHPEDFEKQLEWITTNYEVVSPEELGKPRGTKPFCVITFDDGTKDQYEVAFQILNKKGLPGYFTVMSGPLTAGKIPIMHLVHTVLSFYTDKEIWNELSEEFDTSMVPVKSSNIYWYEKDIYRRYNKYTLNFLLNEQQSRPFLEGKLLSKFRSIKDFIDSFYINEIEFRKMISAGMTIGVHAKDHVPYNGTGIKYFNEEIKPCMDYISNSLGINPKWYTPAFGGGENTELMLNELKDILKRNGFLGGFTTREGYNHELSEFWLNRFDCAKLLKNNNCL